MKRPGSKRLPNRKLIPLLAFGALMAGAIPVNLAFFKAEAAKLGLIDTQFQRIAKGKVADEVTQKYNASSPFKDFGIEAFGSLSYFALGEARSGAQIGANSVLFSNEEFETSPDSAGRIRHALKFIAEVDAALKAKGITLIVAPLPLKADIDSVNLGDLSLPAELAGRYAAVRETLGKSGVKSIDLRARFMIGNIENRMFLAADTHWTTEGAAVAAEGIAAAAQSLDLPSPRRVTLTSGEAVEHASDLRKFVRLLPLLDKLGPAHDMIRPVKAEVASEGDGLFGDDAIPVALVGTSYSANPAFGFEAHLKAALQRDVLNLAVEGKGPFAPMQDFLKSDVLKNSPPKLVIWEMPVRYLDDAFAAEQLTLPASLP